jgi:hypothetical protein
MKASAHFVLDDLAASDAADLQRRQLAVKALLPLLHLQQLRRHHHTAALIAAWQDLYRRLLATAGGQDLVAQLICYVTAVSKDDLDHLRSAFADISKPTEDQFMTSAQKLIEEGLQRGRRQGRHEGRQEGRHEGSAELLLKQLQQRFGALPPAIVDRVRTGTTAELEVWALQILTAPSLETLFPT